MHVLRKCITFIISISFHNQDYFCSEGTLQTNYNIWGWGCHTFRVHRSRNAIVPVLCSGIGTFDYVLFTWCGPHLPCLNKRWTHISLRHPVWPNGFLIDLDQVALVELLLTLWVLLAFCKCGTYINIKYDLSIMITIRVLLLMTLASW